jgi:hypothetical protein
VPQSERMARDIILGPAYRISTSDTALGPVADRSLSERTTGEIVLGAAPSEKRWSCGAD